MVWADWWLAVFCFRITNSLARSLTRTLANSLTHLLTHSPFSIVDFSKNPGQRLLAIAVNARFRSRIAYHHLPARAHLSCPWPSYSFACMGVLLFYRLFLVPSHTQYKHHAEAFALFARAYGRSLFFVFSAFQRRDPRPHVTCAYVRSLITPVTYHRRRQSARHMATFLLKKIIRIILFGNSMILAANCNGS